MTLIVFINLLECGDPLIIYDEESEYFRTMRTRWVGLEFDWEMDFNLN